MSPQSDPRETSSTKAKRAAWARGEGRKPRQAEAAAAAAQGARASRFVSPGGRVEGREGGSRSFEKARSVEEEGGKAGGRGPGRHGEGRAAAAEPRGAGGGRRGHGAGHGVAAESGGHLRLRHPGHRRRAAPGLGVLRPRLLPVAHPHARLPPHGSRRRRRARARRLEIQTLPSQNGHADDDIRFRTLQVVDVRI